MSMLTDHALEGSGLSSKETARCRNYFALGLMYWLYSRPMEQQLEQIQKKFGKKPQFVEANQKVFKAGYAFGETAEIGLQRYEVPASKLAPGLYRTVTGNFAVALGFATVAKLTGKQVFLGSYPITPATEILQESSYFKEHGVVTYQAEDEIAGIGSAIGASFGGALGCTTTSGPGLALKAEMMGLAVIAELPLVDRRRAARRPLHGHAHQDRAVRPAGGALRPPRRGAHAGHRRAEPGRLLLGHPRGHEDRHQVDDPGAAAHRRLPRQRLRAVQDPGPQRAAQDRRQVPDHAQPRRRLHAVQARRQADPPLGHPGHARPRAPHRRPREGLDVGHGLLRRHEPRADGPDPGRRRSPTSIEDVPDVEVYGKATGELLLVSWGGTFGSVRGAAEQLQAAGQERLPRPPALAQPAAARTWARC